jgi:hypothetical protein
MDLGPEPVVSLCAFGPLIAGSAVQWWWDSARRQPPRRTHDGIVLEMPLRMASVLSALFIFGVLVYLWSVVVGLGTKLLPLWVFVGVAGSFFIRRMVTVRHELHDRGLRYRAGLGARRDVSWIDIIGIDYSSFHDALELRLRDGKTARISTQMIGFGQLCRAILDHVPVLAASDPKIHAFLSDSADEVATA